MRSRLLKLLRHPWRTAAALVLVTAAPKCVACLFAYATLGALLGFSGGPELCGAPSTSPAPPFAGWTNALAWCGFGGALAIVAAARLSTCRRRQAAPARGLSPPAPA